jgi:hypothetical protein
MKTEKICWAVGVLREKIAKNEEGKLKLGEGDQG